MGINERIQELKQMGGIQESEHIIIKGSTVPISTIDELNNEDWNELLHLITNKKDN